MQVASALRSCITPFFFEERSDSSIRNAFRCTLSARSCPVERLRTWSTVPNSPSSMFRMTALRRAGGMRSGAG